MALVIPKRPLWRTNQQMAKQTPNAGQEQDNNHYAMAYSRLKTTLLGFLRARLDDPSMAEDIVHDAFVKALIYESGYQEGHQHKHQSNSSGNIKNIDAWLKSIVRHVLVDYYRAKKQNLSAIDKELIALFEYGKQEDAERPSSASLHNEDPEMEIHHVFAQFLRPFIDCLPHNYASVLVSKEYDKKSVKEIALEMSLSESAIKSRLSRGRQLLKKELMLCCEIEVESGIVLDFIPRAIKSCP